MSASDAQRARANRLLAQFHEESKVATQKLDWEMLRELYPFAKPHLKLYLLSFALMPIGAAVVALQPRLLQQAVDSVGGGKGTAVLGWVVAQYGFLIALRFFASAIETYTMQLAGQRTLALLRVKVFEHVQSLAIRYFDRTPVGRIVTRVTNDIDALAELFASGAVTALGDVLILISVVVAMLTLDLSMSLMAFVAIPLLVVVVEVLRRILRGAQRSIRAYTAQLNAYLNEQVQGLSVVQAFSRERECLDAYDDINRDYREAYRVSIRTDAMMYSVVDAIATVGVGLVLWYAARRMGFVSADHAEAEKGTFIALYAYIQQFFVPVRDLSSKYTMIQSALASAERVFGLLSVKDLDAPVAAQALPAAAAGFAVELDDVSFRYRDQGPPTLDHVTLAVRPGETVALVGATGAGKTTVTALLLRLYDVADGCVRVEGRDVRTLSRTELRRRFAVVQQDVFLFAGTLLSNIALGENEPDVARAEHALSRVGAAALFAARGGLQMQVVERGGNLSSGERQLIAFARALYRDPPILILDEATANVDSETEARLQSAVDALLAERTAVVIAHRLSTIRKVDRIVVFHRGAIVEQGTHADLLTQGGVYARLHQLQFALDDETQSSVSA